MSSSRVGQPVLMEVPILVINTLSWCQWAQHIVCEQKPDLNRSVVQSSDALPHLCSFSSQQRCWLYAAPVWPHFGVLTVCTWEGLASQLDLGFMSKVMS